LGLVLLFFSSDSSSGQNSSLTTDAFPPSQGTYWIYRGIVRSQGPNSKVSENKVTWKMQIKRVIRRPNVTAFVINGFPSDLDWSDGTAEPQDSLVIQTQDNKLYRIEIQALPDTLRRLGDPHDDLAGVLNDNDLFLKLPLHKGDKFCEAESMTRNDGMYCWVVESVRSASFKAVKGLPSFQRKAFTVSYRTLPDDSEFDFVPGLGITGYGYHHHGTVAETEVRLVEFHPGGSP
jgi:hypothetical protein